MTKRQLVGVFAAIVFLPLASNAAVYYTFKGDSLSAMPTKAATLSSASLLLDSVTRMPVKQASSILRMPPMSPISKAMPVFNNSSNAAIVTLKGSAPVSRRAPEPATVGLLGLGLLAIGLARRRNGVDQRNRVMSLKRMVDISGTSTWLRGAGLVLAAVIAAPLSALANPQLNLDVDNQIIGATNIQVGAEFYNVELVEGTCDSVYGAQACQNSDFFFSTQGAAASASAALLSLIQQEDPNAASGTLGCIDPLNCSIFTLTSYALTDTTQSLQGARVLDRSSSGEHGVEVFFPVPNPAFLFDTASEDSYVFARWTPGTGKNPVPEPATFALAAIGLIGMGMVRRRRRSA